MDLGKALDRNETISIFCRCEIEYDGRAQSRLEEGDRLLIIKADNTLIVHQPEGSSPVNYMPAGSRFTIDDDLSRISCRNSKEYMDIRISKIYSAESRRLEDGASLILKGSEKDMADMIAKQPELIEPGFRPLSREEHTKHGFIDVFGYDKDNTLVVIECKRYSGDLKAVSQLRRYVEKIKKSRGLEKVRGILACPAISTNALKMLEDWGFEYRQIRPPKHLEKHDGSQMKLTDIS